MLHTKHYSVATVLVALGLIGTRAIAAPVVYQANGPSPASIQSMVDAFRTDLGANNGTGPGPFMTGRREINWDAVPAGSSSPNALAGDFFNQLAAPRARGAKFTTPGSSLQVSADVASGNAIEFGNINPLYQSQFRPFSVEKLFSPIGSTITDVTFSIPGQPLTLGRVGAFGVVFTDVDLSGSTKLDYFDAAGSLMHTQTVPGSIGREGQSFAGVRFDAGEKAARVRITSGNTPLGVDDNPQQMIDVVAMDDFIYAEPMLIPEPATGLLALLALGVVALLAGKRKK